jgi:hypothetical protein
MIWTDFEYNVIKLVLRWQSQTFLTLKINRANPTGDLRNIIIVLHTGIINNGTGIWG